MTERELITSAVMQFFHPRRWAVVPRASWGLPGLVYEADAIAVSESGVVHELEAKSSAADLRVDRKKRKWERHHRGEGRKIFSDCLWYVLPDTLVGNSEDWISEIGAGVIAVRDPAPGDILGWCRKVREPKRHKSTRSGRHDRDMRNKVWRLCALRYWNLLVSERKGDL